MFQSGHRRYNQASLDKWDDNEGEDYVFCYDYSGDQFLLDLDRYMHCPMDACWMNPQDGTYRWQE